MEFKFELLEDKSLRLTATDGEWVAGMDYTWYRGQEPLSYLEEAINDFKNMCYDKSKKFKEKSTSEEKESEKEFRRSAESED
jgi:hypothetical protein